METANLWCPLCRKRVSSWARRNFRNPVDVHRRKEIQKVLASPGFADQDILEIESGKSNFSCNLQIIRNLPASLPRALGDFGPKLLPQQARGNSTGIPV